MPLTAGQSLGAGGMGKRANGLREEAPPEQGAVATSDAIEPAHVVVLDATQALREAAATPNEQVVVRRQHAVSVHLELSSANRSGHARQEGANVAARLEHRASGEATVHHVKPRTRSVTSRGSGHRNPDRPEAARVAGNRGRTCLTRYYLTTGSSIAEGCAASR